jgi:nitrogen-specific signal transduction histidine kinase
MTQAIPKVHFTSQIDLSTGCHIVYPYTEIDYYLNNAAAFIAEGLDKKHLVVYIDKPDHYKRVTDLLNYRGYSEDKIKEIIYEECDKYYETNDAFKSEHVFRNFHRILAPFLEENKIIRTWGLVSWKEQESLTLSNGLKKYEAGCDECIKKYGNIITVCAYDGMALPSSILCELLQTHEYHMTDHYLAVSGLQKKKSVIFPSLSEQLMLEKETEDLLIRSEKLSVAGQLAAGLAHEIRNPLTAIKGFFQLMQSHGLKQEYYDIVSDEFNRIEMILTELLILAKPQEAMFERCDLIPLIEHVAALLDTQAIMKNIAIRCIFRQPAVIVPCDENQIKQVFINIVKNAIESMNHSGEIVIEVKPQADSKQVDIEITDQGSGIPDKILSQIGKPFFSTKENGTGLGMMISHNIVNNHGGSILIDSKMNQGTTFKVVLPMGGDR